MNITQYIEKPSFHNSVHCRHYPSNEAEGEDYIDLGAATLDFYSSLVDLLAKCAPDRLNIQVCHLFFITVSNNNFCSFGQAICRFFLSTRKLLTEMICNLKEDRHGFFVFWMTFRLFLKTCEKPTFTISEILVD